MPNESDEYKEIVGHCDAEWKIKLAHPISELELLAKPCFDCAVTTGFYALYSDALNTQSTDIKLVVSKKWFCHNYPGKACRGNANNCGVSW